MRHVWLYLVPPPAAISILREPAHPVRNLVKIRKIENLMSVLPFADFSRRLGTSCEKIGGRKTCRKPRRHHAMAHRFRTKGWKPVGRSPPLPACPTRRVGSRGRVSPGTSLPEINFDSEGGTTLETFTSRSGRFDRSAHAGEGRAPAGSLHNNATH